MLQMKMPVTNSELKRLVMVSNRLPVSMEKEENGTWIAKPGSGGLVSALSFVLRERGGLWIGWPGILGKPDNEAIALLHSQNLGYDLETVTLTSHEVEQYYHGFSNEILWPLFHDLQSFCNFQKSYWEMYQRVNQKFAQVIAKNIKANDYIWIHDYHLMMTAKELRAMGHNQEIGFFLHTPFPSPDIFLKLPWRQQILRGLLDYNLLGFQTARDRNNFIHCAESLIKQINPDTRRQVATIRMPNRNVKAGIFPISIDFNEFSRYAALPSVTERAEQLREMVPNCQIVLGVDRMDYSKGIPQKLEAFGEALVKYPELQGNITLIQIAVPSREGISEYQKLKAEVNRLVSEINGRLAQPDWLPIHYLFRSVDKTELIAYYSASDIALITPLKDGMNLVAKEYCASQTDGDGVLILSEFAGSAAQMKKNALLVNPYDIEGVASAIHRAYLMNSEERQPRIHRLRNQIHKRDIFWWVDSFLRTASSITIASPDQG